MNRRSVLQRNFNSFVDSSFTLFVDNLSHDVGHKWFRSFFSNFGFVKRYFIPNKVSKRSGCRFGFVTFGNRDEAILAIANSNGIWIDNRNLFVKMASFTKNPNPQITQIPNPQTHLSQPCFISQPSSFNPHPPKPPLHSNPQHQFTSKPKSYAEILKNSTEKRITIKVHPTASSWLSNCSVVKLKSPSTPEVILKALQMAGISNIDVKSMGGLVMLLIFNSKDERNNALSNPTLKNWFASFKPWNGEPASLSRFVWLKCRGVPIQAWNTSTFRRIGESWGDFINLDEETMKELSYDIGRMLITTDNELSIDEWINILINGRNYRVRVWEEPCDDPFAVICKSQVNIGVQTGVSIDSVIHSPVKNSNISHGDVLEGVKDLLTAMPAQLDAQSETESTFRKISSNKQAPTSVNASALRNEEEDDEVARREGDKDNENTDGNRSMNCMEERDKDVYELNANKENLLCPKVILLDYKSEHADVGEQLMAENTTNESAAPMAAESNNLETGGASNYVNSNYSQDLDSFVEDSEYLLDGDLKSVNENDVVRDSEAQSEEAEDNIDAGLEQLQKEAERNLELSCGPFVICSSNGIRASQLDGINLQVDLNPQKFRKALRSLTFEACSSSRECEEIHNSLVSAVNSQEERVLEELQRTNDTGARLQIDFGITDEMIMRKMIEIESKEYNLFRRKSSA